MQKETYTGNNKPSTHTATNVWSEVVCDKCGGKGHIHCKECGEHIKCKKCNGTGKLSITHTPFYTIHWDEDDKYKPATCSSD